MNAMQGVLIHEPSFLKDPWYADDRENVSKLHRELQHRSLKWLANRCRASCYGSIEIHYKGLQCDALAVTRPNERFKEAVSGYKWTDTMIVLFEAKASRSDFMATFGSKSCALLKNNPPGNYRFLVKPKKVEMPLDLLPPEWGVLEARGCGLGIVKPATCVELEHLEDHIDALFAILHYGDWGKRQLMVPCPDCGGAEAAS